MGIIIGSLLSDGSLCVESPDSPSIDVGEAGVQPVVSNGANGPAGNYGYISQARTVKVKRKFTLKKKDISAVTNWLTTLSGGSVAYNAGADGQKTIAGTFRLDGEIVFSPVSPSLCEAQATFIGTTLDCNFLLPAGVEFTVIDSKTSAIVVNDVERTRFTSATIGDGSGISIRAGGCLFHSDIPDPYRNGLAAIYGEELNPDRLSDTRAKVLEVPYREILLCNNGETMRTWYIPCNMSNRVSYLYPQTVCYGVTKAEYESDGFPVFTDIIDLSDESNDRLVGGLGGSWDKYIPKDRPVGSLFQWYGYNDILSNGSYESGKRVHKLMWDESKYGPNPNKYLYLVDVGTIWNRTQYSKWWTPFYSEEETTVRIGWSLSGSTIRLSAIGSDGQVNTLLEYA